MHILIDKKSTLSLSNQISSQIKNMILNGDLKSDQRLLSTRLLAEELNVSRNVVIEAYDILIAEGYTRSLRGSGHFINPSITIERNSVTDPNISLIKLIDDKSLPISFRTGMPSVKNFPFKKWLQCYRDTVLEADNLYFGYGHPAGHVKLRKTLSNYLYKSRGIRCHEDQIIITNGTTQAFGMLARYFNKDDGKVIIEDPMIMTLDEILKINGLETVHSPVDDQGINPIILPQEENILGVFITPSHQYPMGGALSISRRIDLVKYARQNNCYIIEDDYDCEYNYSKFSVSSLHELDPEHVVYLGTFSKILLPGLRLGYMVLPKELVKDIFLRKNLLDIHTPILDQMTLEKFIARGYIDQHLSRMKKIYYRKKQVVRDALLNEFGEQVTIIGGKIGLHLVADFKDVVFTNELIKTIESKGVYVMRVSEHSVFPEIHESKLILGYGALNEEEIIEGIHKIRLSIDEHKLI